MVSINLTQEQLYKIMENIFKKGNEFNDMETKDAVNEIKQSILTVCFANSEDTK
ncbi:hypothetical protein ACFCYN_00985 [Gottfriedia sp. NPDC056225]|uniref:hypothetical protein n=1 Tax=Gottfriedia sp. NPDC056225 TaxID=3345751 RepID=UPI00155945B3|nr:hypothetical protein HPK19_16675 [Arthrobacter citreus]